MVGLYRYLKGVVVALVGHHLTLARRRGSELWFYICLLLLLVLLVANYFELWNSWLRFL